MIRIIIFGTGELSEVLMKILETQKVEVIAFSDNDIIKQNRSFKNKKVIAPKEINKYSYDYIIIASQYHKEIYHQLIEMNINENSIVAFYNLIQKYFNYKENMMWDKYCKEELNNKFAHLIDVKEEVEALITGISYSKFSICEEELKMNSINFALPAQDLFYDYQILKKIIREIKCKNLKYAIIGLTYYSFQYDLSKSSTKNRCVNTYYELFKTKHNYEKDNYSIAEKCGFIDMFVENYEKELKEYYHSKNKIAHNNFNEYWDMTLKEANISNEIKQERCKELANIDSKKNYCITKDENIKILNDIVNLLRNNNIIPIFIVCPLNKYYLKEFPIRLKDEFYYEIKKIMKNDIKLYDYSSLDIFEMEEEFCDLYHLNRKGASKFTKLINEVIW